MSSPRCPDRWASNSSRASCHSTRTSGRGLRAWIATQVNALKNAGVDFILLVSSSSLNENDDLLPGTAVSPGLPVLSPYESVVREVQALMSVAARYGQVGRLAATQARKILCAGVPAGSPPIAHMTRFAVVINMQVEKKLKVLPPRDLLQIAETVN